MQGVQQGELRGESNAREDHRERRRDHKLAHLAHPAQVGRARGQFADPALFPRGRRSLLDSKSRDSERCDAERRGVEGGHPTAAQCGEHAGPDERGHQLAAFLDGEPEAVEPRSERLIEEHREQRILGRVGHRHGEAIAEHRRVDQPDAFAAIDEQ